MYWKIFSSSLLLLSFVYVNAQVPTRTNPRDVVIDTNRQELDNLLLRKPILTAEDNSVRQATLKQINEDFKALQALNNQVMSKVTSPGQLDYKLIANKISELEGKATRLRKNLVLPKVEKHTKSVLTISTPEELKQALLELDKVVVSFVNNPIFKMTNVIEVESAKQASSDLELLIKQSESLKKAAFAQPDGQIMKIKTKHGQYRRCVVFVLILLLASTSYSQDAKKQISILTDDVEKLLSTLKVSNDLTQQCTKDVADTRAYLKSENFYLSLYTIRTCKLELDSQAFAASKADVEKKGMEAFEQEWRQLGSSLTDKEHKVDLTIAKRPAAVAVALAQVSQVQARPYYQSGRLFALNSSMSEGLYYLGRAPSNLDFAIFLRGLNSPQSKIPVTFRSSEQELTKLETAILKTYRGADVNSQQANFNRLNSNLKIAGELNRAKMFEGALLKYLETRLFFGLLITTAENEDIEHLRERSRELGRQLKADKTDQSVAALFYEMAETSLNPSGKTEPTAAQVKRAAVILNIVLPSYSDYLKETK